jgi:Utp13 specific WD40 associated domain
MSKQYLEAAALAINLRQPKQLLEIVKNVLCSLQLCDGITHRDYIAALAPLTQQLSGEDVHHLLAYIRDWNTSTRNCCCAQALLGAIFATRHPKVSAAPCTDVALVPCARLLLHPVV